MKNYSGERNLRRFPPRVNIVAAVTLWLALCSMSTLPRIGNAQTWTSIPAPLASSRAMLLTDGTVIVQDLEANDWWKLTPDIFGSYANGTWSEIDNLPDEQGQPYGPLWYGSAVLGNGKVVICGGEYDGPFSGEVWFNGGAAYDPIADKWTILNGPPGWELIGDAASCVTPTGQWILQDPFYLYLPGAQCMASLDPDSLQWSFPFGTNKSDPNDEEGWTLLPDGLILTVDVYNVGNSELFDPVYGNWYSAGNTVADLIDPVDEEVGPQVLRPDGTIVCFGATGDNAMYNWGNYTLTAPTPGTWAAIPSFPFDFNVGLNLDCADAPAALLTDGNVLVCASPGFGYNGLNFFEFDGVNLNPAPEMNIDPTQNSSYQIQFLMLPTGQILATDFFNEVELYTNPGKPQPQWAPQITQCPTVVTQGQTYSLQGLQLNGLSQDGAYGDDVQNATNYPLVRVTMEKTGHVIYYRTHDHSSMGVATGTTPVFTNFDVPYGAETGGANLVVVTNGIPSKSVFVTVLKAPQANAQTVVVPHNKATAFTLTGSDPYYPNITFNVVSQPTNGTLSGLNPSTGAITYTPNLNFAGIDTFTFTVSVTIVGGTETSAPATVTLSVVPGVPTALTQTVQVPHNTATTITLIGVDPDNPPIPLVYAVSAKPAHGTLIGLNPITGTILYTPSANYQGADSFTFTASNGAKTSPPAKVSLIVAAGMPIGNPQTIGVPANKPIKITLTGADTDTPPLPITYSVVVGPYHGTISGPSSTTGTLTYTPTSGYKGDDTFFFVVNNGQVMSLYTLVTLVVAPGTPTATAQTVSVGHNTPSSLVLTGLDSDTPALPLTFAIASSPAHGTLTGFNASTGAVTYTPTTVFQGKDSFTFTVTNGINKSAAATVTLNVAPGFPTANPQTVVVKLSTAKAITLIGTDLDVPALPLTFAIAVNPTHGTLSGLNTKAGTVTYTPKTGYKGPDSFTFTVSNGTNKSTPGTVTLSDGN